MNNVEKIHTKLSILFDFLKKNRSYNKFAQEAYYKALLTPYQSVNDKVISLLYGIINTQSQPKLNLVGRFMYEAHSNAKLLGSYEGFLKFLGSADSDNRYCRVFELLKGRSGWGEKTSALFEKTIYHLHSGLDNDSLRIWSDAPNKLTPSDRLYLPVDTVIINIFKSLGCTSLTFADINKLLVEAAYTNKQLEIWDDLWFWGYITQKGSGNNRQMVFNENKYWAYPYFNKKDIVINKTKERAGRFIQIVRGRYEK